MKQPSRKLIHVIFNFFHSKHDGEESGIGADDVQYLVVAFQRLIARRLYVYFVLANLGIRHSIEPHPRLLLFSYQKAKDGGTEEQIQRQETLSQKSHSARVDRNHCLHSLLESLLGKWHVWLRYSLFQSTLPSQVSQMALINSPPDVCQSKLEVTIFLLVGCLGYSNSAINPVLYAFLR